MTDDFLTSERREELLELFRISARALSIQGIAGTEVDRQFYTAIRLRSIDREDCDEATGFTTFLQDLVTSCGARFGVKLPHVEVQWATLAHDNPARVTQQGKKWLVEIDDRYIIDDLTITVAIAHELAHVFLGSKSIRLFPTKRNEELTDITSLLVGFGRLMSVVAGTPKIYRDGDLRITTEMTLGYLKKHEIEFLLRCRDKIFSCISVRIFSVIPVHNNARFKCANCQVSIRAPLKKATFKMNCPVCSVSHIIRVGPYYAGQSVLIQFLERRFLQPLLEYLDGLRGAKIY